MMHKKVNDKMCVNITKDAKKQIIFFCDIDGTIVKGEMEIPPIVIEEAKKFMDLGGILCLCTGRAPISVSKIAKKLEVNGPSVLYSGAAGFDFSKGSYVWCDTFSENIKAHIEELLKKYPTISVQVYTKERIYLLRTNAILTNKGVKAELSKTVSRLSDIDKDEEIIKIVLTDEDIRMLENSRQEIFSSSEYIFEFASKHFVEVIPKTAGKDRGAQRIIEHLGLDNPMIISAGDAMTDLPLLKISDISFAPQDADKKVLEAVTYVFSSYKTGGVAQAFKKASELI